MSLGDDTRIIPLGAAPSDPPSPTLPLAVIVAIVTVGVAVVIVVTASPGSAITWSDGAAPQSVLNARSVVATPTGFSILGGLGATGGQVWSTTDGLEWNPRTLPHLSRRIVYHRRGLFVIDRSSLTRIGPDGDDPMGRLDLPEPIRVGRGSGRAGLVAGLDGLVAQTVSGEIFWSPDGRTFESVLDADEWGAASDVTPRPSDVVDVAAGRVRSECDTRAQIAPDVPPVLSTPSSLVAFIPEEDPSVIWPVCEPVLWHSTDGTTWEPASLESPFPETAYVYDVAWRDDRMVAVGGVGFDDSFVWTSDDGDIWTEVEGIAAGPDADITRVEAGPAGWVVVATPRDGSAPFGWYSTDGACWEAIPPNVAAPGAAVGDSLVLFVHDDPARIAVGTPTGSTTGASCA